MKLTFIEAADYILFDKFKKSMFVFNEINYNTIIIVSADTEKKAFKIAFRHLTNMIGAKDRELSLVLKAKNDIFSID